MEGNMRNDVAHALLRAVSALVPTPAAGRLSATHQGVETSLDTARKSACATWLLLAAACPFLAQTPLTLQDAEALAIKNHPQVQAAQLNYQASQQAVAEARSAYFPTLQGDVTASQGNPQARIGAGALVASRVWDRFGQGITLSQLITDSGRTRNLVASSRLQAQASSQTYQATRYDVLLRVNQGYFQALQAQALVKVADETVAARQLLVDQVTALAQNKLRSQLDVSFASVNLAQAKLLLIRAQDGVAQGFAELTRALGLDQQQAYKLNEEPLPPSPPADSADLVTQAFQQRPELAGVRLERESAYRFERAEHDLSYPTVSLAGVGGFIPYIRQLTTQTVPPEYESAAVNVEIPIFNGGLFAARREAARFKAQAADQRVRDLEEGVARDVRVAWSDSLTAYHQLDVTAELLRDATMALDLAQGRYNLGLSSIVELTQAQLNLTEAEVENLGAKYDYQKSYAVLRYATGMLR
jgi:outer membrane protein